ncbi:MAG: hypothetical protein ACREMP_00025 [Candidatus Tyrphobacter sp.]
MLSASVPPIVAKISQEYRRTQRGIVAVRYHRVFDVHAGPRRQHEDLLFDGIYVDGTLVKVKVLHYTIGRKNADTKQVAEVVNSYEHPKPGDVFEAPWDPRFMTEYRFTPTPDRTIRFTALDTSYGHGNGSFTYDAGGNVVSYAYSPTVLPAHAKTATVQGLRSQTLANYWAVTSESQSYSGHYSIFAAAATLAVTQSDFRRFANLASALSFVAADASVAAAPVSIGRR